MSGLALATLLSAFSTGQFEANYWEQWHQFGPYSRMNGRFPDSGFDYWDWWFGPPALWGRLPAYRNRNGRLEAQPTPRPRPMPARNGPNRYHGPGPAVRLSLNDLAPDSPTLISFRKALDAMRKLPPDDPHSLIYQANIHGFPPTTTTDPLWGQCPHGNWWFFPWHRAYLHCFEKIVRRYAEDPTFALPYWDYGAEAGRALPAPFRDPASPLYDSTRLAQANNGTDQLSAAVVVDGFNASMANTVFADFGSVTTFGGQALNEPAHRNTPHGALEAVPHDLVHSFIGGNMVVAETSGRDPVFFCHHANIDRYWIMWLQMGQGRANPADETWLNQQFTFYDENKQQINISVRQVLDTAALGYTYDRTSPPGPPPSTPTPQTPVETVATLNTSNIALQDNPVTLTMVIPERIRGRLRNGPAMRLPAQGPVPRMYLQMEAARFKSVPDSCVAVYVNLPPYSPIPGPRSPHFAGFFTFFGDHHNVGFASRVNITLQLLRFRQMPAQQRADFTVTLVRFAPGTMPRDFRAPLTFKELTLLATK